MPRLTITQKIHPISNRDVITADDGTELCHVKAKKFRLREELVLWKDDSEHQSYARVKARSVIDFAGAYDVFDDAGELVGTLRRSGLRSLLRVRWEIVDAHEQPIATVTEDRLLLAVLRRLGDIPVPLRFTFTTPDGTVIGHHRRRMGVRDRYEVDVTGVDTRLIAAIGVSLDLLEER